jgi:TatD DNase family protein
MASDAHLHPYDLYQKNSEAQSERIRLNIKCAASAFNKTDFLFNEELSKDGGKDRPYMALCYGIHPQLPTQINCNCYNNNNYDYNIEELKLFLEQLASEKRIAAVGETGFDLYNNEYKATEAIQQNIFEHHLSVSLEYNLPMVLHIRRAMHKFFEYCDNVGMMKKLPAVVFHSYSGSPEEARSILKRGINAYFSFGNAILLNHKNAMRCVAALPAEHLLFETDAPYQSLKGRDYSSYADIVGILQQAVQLRANCDIPSIEELEQITDNNFCAVFGCDRKK